MSPHALFIRLSVLIMIVLVTGSLYMIHKSSVDAWAGSTGISLGDLIGAEIGGTLGVMIRDDPHPTHSDKVVDFPRNDSFRAFNVT